MLAAAWLMLSSLLYSLQLQTGSFPKPLTEEEERHYLALAAQGDLEARNVLIERNLRLVAHIMKKYYAQTADQEDLISIGTIGLIKGITTFDASKGARLATYAARCVENEILMYFRSQKKSAQDVSLSDYIETGTDGAALSLMDVVAEDSDLLEQITNQESVSQLRQAIERCLTEQEKLVIRLRYGLDGMQPHRQREVAIWRGAHQGCLVLLGSATPSVETMYRAREGTYGLYTLKNRFGGQPLLHKSREPRVSCLNPGKTSRDLLQHVSRPDSPTMAREQ